MTATDRLRQAAQKIRDTARLPMEMTDSAEEPWWCVKPLGGRAITTKWDLFADAYPEDAGLIALWSPPVALAIADWLEDIAADKDSGLGCIHPRALDVTNLILGSDQ